MKEKRKFGKIMTTTIFLFLIFNVIYSHQVGAFDASHFQIGINIGDTHTLEIYYMYAPDSPLESGAKMYYNVTNITVDTCYITETIFFANGSLYQIQDYNDSRSAINMPFFYTTINVSLLYENFMAPDYFVSVDSEFIYIEQYTNSSGLVTDGIYTFHAATGWLYSYVMTMTNDGTLMMEIDMRDINYDEPVTTTTIPFTTTTDPETSTEYSTSTTEYPTTTVEETTTSDAETTEEPTSDDSDTTSEEKTTSLPTTIPSISPSSGIVSLVVIGILGFVNRRKRG